MRKYSDYSPDVINKETERILDKFGPRRALEYLTREVYAIPYGNRSVFTKRLKDLRKQVELKNQELQRP